MQNVDGENDRYPGNREDSIGNNLNIERKQKYRS